MDVPRLSCEQCRRRKTKCDKESPCSACAKAGIVCNSVARNRKPRGATKRVHPKGNSLSSRLSHLEEMVVQLRAHTKKSQNTEHSDRAQEVGDGQNQPSPNLIGKYVAPSFWEALSTEVTGIRDILEDGKDGNDEVTTENPNGLEQGQLETQSQATARTLLFNHSNTVSERNSQIQQYLTPQISHELLQVYKERVDSIFKVVDWPSVTTMLKNKQNQNKNQNHTDSQITLSERALEYSIYFTALCTLSDQECEDTLSCTRESLLPKIRSLAETAISEARLLQTPDLTVLQGFVIYLAGLRSSSQCASSWSLLSIAVRIAISMRLGSDDNNHSIYDIQLRRRVWYSIGMMDCQFALDRGSLPLLYISDFTHPPPLNINDCDLHTATVSAQGFTEMTFSSLTHEAMLCQKKLYEKPTESQDAWALWNWKISAVSEFEESITQRFADINDQSSPLERFTKAVSRGTLANLQVMLRRPPYRNESNSVPPCDLFDVMSATTTLLEISLHKRAEDAFSPWKWFYWVKWYALAVLLAELCRPYQGVSVQKSLSVAQMTFKDYSHLISDSETGMLWKPIAKLMHRVESLRRNEGGPPSLAHSSCRPDATGGDLGLGALRIPDHSFDLGAHDPGAFVQPNPSDVPWNLNSNTRIDPDGVDHNWQMWPVGNTEDDDQMCWMLWDRFIQDING